MKDQHNEEADHKIEVRTYGIHWNAEGVAYLHQGRNASNFLSLKAPSPYAVVPARRLACNHLFPVSAAVPDPTHWKQFQALARDPLVRVMLPIPKGDGEAGVFVMEDTNDEMTLTLLTLSRMSSPIQPIVRPIWHFSPNDISAELERTNVQPLVLTQANPKYQKVVDAIIDQSVYMPRRVVITGTYDVVARKPAQRLKTGLLAGEEGLIVSLPLESLGVAVLRRYARREDMLSDLPTARGRGA
ncbi:Uncharacterised protein [Burkholderia pseudomallei]|nr:Uncharacterised protein [Burkholderia pseudomallei]